MKFTFVVSDESVNNYGFRILSDGIDTTQFEKNPVGYYMHQRRTGEDYTAKGDEVICRWENLQKVGGVVMADAVFDESDEKAMKIAKKIEGKFIRMASIGVDPIETSEDAKLLLPGQIRPTVTKSILSEISIVDRGGNNNAMVKLYDGDQDYELPLIQNTMKLEDDLRKQLNLSAGESITEHVALLLQENQTQTDYKTKYEALVKLNQEKREAEAVKLVDDAIEAKAIKAEKKETYIQLFKADHSGAKAVLEDLMGKAQASPKDKLGNFLDDLKPGEGGKETDAKKDWAWYELNAPEQLLAMKSENPEQFQKLFDESL